MTTIVLAEDHPIVRQGLRALLEGEQDFSVVGEIGDGLEVSDLVATLKPDILILDVMLPGLSGLDALLQVKRRSPNTRVVVLSMYANEAYVLQALRNGASGYVLKDADTEHLVEAVRTVNSGGRYLSPPLTERAIEAYLDKAKDSSLDLYDTLTAREREVLHLAAEGNTIPQIAARLTISPRTVETHRTNLMRKLHLTTQADLLRFALQRGIISLDD